MVRFGIKSRSTFLPAFAFAFRHQFSRWFQRGAPRTFSFPLRSQAIQRGGGHDPLICFRCSGFSLSLSANGARHLGVDKWSLSRQVLWERFALSGLRWSCPCKTSGQIHSLSLSRLYLQTKITEHFSRIRRPRKNMLLISGVPCYQGTL